MPPKGKYTDPELRDQVKQEIQDSDKGGAPGQWSARKAQFMASEYKKRGGGYNTEKSEKDESQKNLDHWTEEEWQTKEGSGHAKQEDGTEKRYLPKKAWENMNEDEKEETERKKLEGSKKGKQFVENTEKAKESRRKVKKTVDEGEEDENNDEGEEGEDDDEEDEYDDENDQDEEGFDGEGAEGQYGNIEEEEDDNEEDEDEIIKTRGQKRKNDKQQSNDSSKKQKDNSSQSKSNGTVGSKHMEEKDRGQKGSKDRLPKKGQQVQWKALPGYVDGEVVEIVTKAKKVDGKDVTASPDDPRIVLKSNSSGKTCIHKPEACYFD